MILDMFQWKLEKWKLAEMKVLTIEKGFDPLLLLDDVFECRLKRVKFCRDAERGFCVKKVFLAQRSKEKRSKTNQAYETFFTTILKGVR